MKAKEIIEAYKQAQRGVFQRASWPLVCPKCRGSNLERQWCDNCGKTGYVTKDQK